jgi:hypothetical protein
MCRTGRRKNVEGSNKVRKRWLLLPSRKMIRVVIICIHDFFSRRKEVAPCVNFVIRILSKLDS